MLIHLEVHLTVIQFNQIVIMNLFVKINLILAFKKIMQLTLIITEIKFISYLLFPNFNYH